jgi:Uma2 family endonuclease
MRSDADHERTCILIRRCRLPEPARRRGPLARDHQSGVRGRRGPPDHEPLGIEHRRIVRAIVDDAKRAFYTGTVTVNWATDENYQWDLPDGSGRFYIPDVAFIHLDATTAEEERAATALVVEVTSPTSPDTVLNDRTTKRVQYAKAGVPLYVLVDQELGRWTLFGLAEGWERYQVAADGAYGQEISLPAPLNFSLTTATWPRWK